LNLVKVGRNSRRKKVKEKGYPYREVKERRHVEAKGQPGRSIRKRGSRVDGVVWG